MAIKLFMTKIFCKQQVCDTLINDVKLKYNTINLNIKQNMEKGKQYRK